MENTKNSEQNAQKLCTDNNEHRPKSTGLRSPASSPTGLEHAGARTPNELGIKEQRMLHQALILGTPARELELEYKLGPGTISDWVALGQSQLSPAARRHVALDRIDRVGAKIMGLIEESEDPDTVSKLSGAYATLQKRESALTGIDQPIKQESDVRVTVDWLKPGRLAYREDTVLAEDIQAKEKAPRLSAS